MDKILPTNQFELGPDQIKGRSIFVIETTANGIQVQTAFYTEGGEVLQMPAIFPDQEYAIAQLDLLRSAVIKHFKEAAQLGAKLIAQTHSQGPGPGDSIQ